MVIDNTKYYVCKRVDPTQFMVYTDEFLSKEEAILQMNQHIGEGGFVLQGAEIIFTPYRWYFHGCMSVLGRVLKRGVGAKIDSVGINLNDMHKVWEPTSRGLTKALRKRNRKKYFNN